MAVVAVVVGEAVVGVGFAWINRDRLLPTATDALFFVMLVVQQAAVSDHRAGVERVIVEEMSIVAQAGAFALATAQRLRATGFRLAFAIPRRVTGGNGIGAPHRAGLPRRGPMAKTRSAQESKS